MNGVAEVHFNQRASTDLHFSKEKSQLRLLRVALERHNFRQGKPLGFLQHTLPFGVVEILAEALVVN